MDFEREAARLGAMVNQLSRHEIILGRNLRNCQRSIEKKKRALRRMREIVKERDEEIEKLTAKLTEKMPL